MEIKLFCIVFKTQVFWKLGHKIPIETSLRLVLVESFMALFPRLPCYMK
jgi:hypothetical protein